MRFGSPLQRVLLDYTQVALAVISQSVACSQHHRVEQRLARWILTMDEYAHPHELVMSHTWIAAMLGSRRSGISIGASHLQDLGLIRYRRGHIVVVDKKGLEQQARQCYRFIKKQHQSLLHQVPRLLSRPAERRRGRAAAPCGDSALIRAPSDSIVRGRGNGLHGLKEQCVGILYAHCRARCRRQ